MKKVIFIFGTRPEVIKLLPLIDIFKEDKKNYNVTVCNVGQHLELVDELIDIFKIKIDHDLSVMSPNQTLSNTSSKIILGLEKLLEKSNYDYMFVIGDTLTAFLSSLLSYHHKIKLCHIESGLRTNDLYSPWPEEGYRRMISQLAYYHFAPSDVSKKNLIAENIDPNKILVSGNTVIDSVFKVLNSTSLKNNTQNILEKISEKKFILITIHRRENFGKNILQICQAIKELAKFFPEFNFVFPVHPNPNVKNVVSVELKNFKNIFLIEPLDYVTFIHFMKKSYLILTDSGGIQEEAPSLDIPVLVLRETTEREDALKSGTIKLVGSNKMKIINEVKYFLTNETAYKKMANTINPYGNGTSSLIIKTYLDEK